MRVQAATEKLDAAIDYLRSAYKFELFYENFDPKINEVYEALKK